MNPIPSASQLPPDYDESRRLGEFRRYRDRGALTAAQTGLYAAEAATALIAQFDKNGEYLSDATALLAEIASLDDPALAAPAHRATFPVLIEQMSDSFDPKRCDLYDRVLAQMIAHCRRFPAAAALDAALARFGVNTEFDFLRRRHMQRSTPPAIGPEDYANVKKALVLSRVTFGADVAITSVVLEKAERVFPNAEIVLLGSHKLSQLFGGDSRVRVRRAHYRTDGGLMERLMSSLAVVEIVGDETLGLDRTECVVIDPDSRLLQLGLIPAAAEDALYFHLESRCFGALGQGNLSAITSRWLNEIFGADETILPSVHLRPPDIAVAHGICERIRKRSSFIATVSLGVGGNNRKRMPDPFEERLILRLIENGASVILDRGFGEEEAERAARIVEAVRQSGRAAVEIDVASLESLERHDELRCSLATWEGEIGPFAALIGQSDEYIGYDSACQHIAAAQGIPAIDIFADSVSSVFQERWTPSGKNKVFAVTRPSQADGTPVADAASVEIVLAEIFAHHAAIKERSRNG